MVTNSFSFSVAKLTDTPDDIGIPNYISADKSVEKREVRLMK